MGGEVLVRAAQRSCDYPIPGNVQGLWNNLVYWKVSLPMAKGWSGLIFKVPPSLKQSGSLWTPWNMAQREAQSIFFHTAVNNSVIIWPEALEKKNEENYYHLCLLPAEQKTVLFYNAELFSGSVNWQKSVDSVFLSKENPVQFPKILPEFCISVVIGHTEDFWWIYGNRIVCEGETEITSQRGLSPFPLSHFLISAKICSTITHSTPFGSCSLLSKHTFPSDKYTLVS